MDAPSKAALHFPRAIYSCTDLAIDSFFSSFIDNCIFHGMIFDIEKLAINGVLAPIWKVTSSRRRDYVVGNQQKNVKEQLIEKC